MNQALYAHINNKRKMKKKEGMDETVPKERNSSASSGYITCQTTMICLS
jgi:hypothetical protein